MLELIVFAQRLLAVETQEVAIVADLELIDLDPEFIQLAIEFYRGHVPPVLPGPAFDVNPSPVVHARPAGVSAAGRAMLLRAAARREEAMTQGLATILL
ncbi:MAG: hypothetical protein ABIK89_17635, partial [Planctomycetota bacterium]